MLPSLLSCYICIQKGKHMIVMMSGKWGSELQTLLLRVCIFLCSVVIAYYCTYVCLLKEQQRYFLIISIPVMKVWVGIFHIY